MGWCTRNNYQGKKLNNQQLKDDFLQEEMRGCKVVSIAIRNNGKEIYCVRELDDGSRYMIVGLVENTSKTIGYKTMDEGMGPGYCNPPKYMYKQLTPTTEPYAIEWRKEAFGVA